MSARYLAPLAAALVLAASAAPAATLLPDFRLGLFERGQPVDARYLPLEPGATAVLRARTVEDGEVVHERSVLRALRRPGPRILGVRTSIQLDKAFEDGLLVEKTFDYFAQDRRGNVWYFGEDVTNFRYDDDGNLIGTDNESAWRAGRRGALPGWIMPVRTHSGYPYYQEFARADEALDKARTIAILPSLTVRGVTYRNVRQVLETNPLEPGSREFKYYAPGVGLIRIEEGLDRNLGNPELVFNLVRRGRSGAAGDRPRAPARAPRAPARGSGGTGRGPAAVRMTTASSQASASGCFDGCASAKAGSASQAARRARSRGIGARSRPKRSAENICGTRQTSARPGRSPKAKAAAGSRASSRSQPARPSPTQCRHQASRPACSCRYSAFR
jgi:hypothetical protein